MKITLTLNGVKRTDEVAADLTLQQYLRQKGCVSVKCGCETGNCGLCTVHLDGKSVLSCTVLAARCDGRTVVTLEGVQEQAAAFGAFLADEGAEQCVLAMERELHEPTEDEIKAYLAGNLCRCSGYQGQMRAIQKYLAAKGERG